MTAGLPCTTAYDLRVLSLLLCSLLGMETVISLPKRADFLQKSSAASLQVAMVAN